VRAAIVLVAATLAVAHAAPATIRVRSEAEFAAAVSALRDSGGTIVLGPHAYREILVVPARSRRPLRILGSPGARVGRILLDHTQHVSLGRLTIAPLRRDAWIDVHASDHVDLHDLVVTAEGTPSSASVAVPDSTHVVIRRSTFTHCGDRSRTWANCLLLREASAHLVVEDSWFHDCYGCDFVHGRFGSDLTLRRNRFERALPCRIGRIRCIHQDLIELFQGRWLRVEANRFGVYRSGGAQLYLTNAIDHVVIENNVFVGTDPRVPSFRSHVALIVGSAGSRRLPYYVRIVNNTILTGSPRPDGYRGSLRMSSAYGGIPRRLHPIVANNVIGLLETPARVCNNARVSESNVVVRGSGCSASDRVGDPHLDALGRPTAASTLLIGRANPRYAPAADITGGLRDAAPDVGAFEFRSGGTIVSP
jgi:hypothetical protein